MRVFLLCSEISPLHIRNIKAICEIVLLQYSKEVLEIMEIKSNMTIFHKRIQKPIVILARRFL